MPDNLDFAALKRLIQDTKKLATEYRRLTGKPLGITGEVGEFIAADLLNLQLTGARNPGYDAIAVDGHKIQIKTRCVFPESSKSQRLGSIKLEPEWETVMLVLIDPGFEPLAIYEAKRLDIERELNRPGSKARNERGSLGISKFKSIAKTVWPKTKK